MSNLSEDERQLIHGLEALAHADECAPPRVRARLRAEFRRKAHWHPARLLTAAAAVVILALLLSRLAPPPPIAIASPDLASFIRLDAEPVSAGIVVRVRLPRAALLDEGGQGDVEADVLLGEDGLAHAVRFIE
jgi:hypothetical protein